MKILDIFHMFVMVLLTLGGVILPVDLLPSLIFFQIFFLSRYHDYCVISKVTEVASCICTGCEEKKNFTEEIGDIYSMLGFKPSTRLLSNGITALVSISILVSIYRMSRKYNFSLVAKNRRFVNWFIIFNLVFVIVSEMVIDHYADTRFPECPPT